MGSEWKYTNIGNELELCYGKALPEKNRLLGNYPIFGSNGIIGSHKEYLAEGTGIIIGRKGSVGEIKYSKENFWAIDTTYFVKLKSNSDLRFWYYFFQTFKLNKMNSHSAVPGLNRDTVYALNCFLPPLKEQIIMASFLGSLDDKIELNCQMNATLEKIGQAIFKHWFVDFEFPNDEGKPYRSSGGKMVDSELGEIPKGWKISTINDVTSLIIDHRGLTPKKLGGYWVQKGIPAISAKNVKAGRIVQSETIKFVNSELFNLWMKEKLELGDILMTSEAPLGELLYLAGNINFCLSQRLFSLRANHDVCMPIYLYYWLNTNAAKERLHSRATGTTVVGIRQSELRKVEVLLPSINIQKMAAKSLENCIMKISRNEEESYTLATIRDAFLPKLMSGEIKVNVLEKEAGAIV